MKLIFQLNIAQKTYAVQVSDTTMLPPALQFVPNNLISYSSSLPIFYKKNVSLSHLN